MKLRILDNSIRLRLDRSEVRQLLTNGSVERQAVFGASASFVYALHAVEQSQELRAEVRPFRIDLYMEIKRAQAWATSDHASIHAVQLAGGVELRLLIEKDFPCEHDDAPDVAEKFTPGAMSVEGGDQ